MLSIALVLAYVQAVGALHRFDFISCLSLDTLKAAAWTPLPPLVSPCGFASSFSLRLGGYSKVDRARVDRARQQKEVFVYIAAATGIRKGIFSISHFANHRELSNWRSLSLGCY